MKKTLMIMLALVLVIAMSVTGTLAYLTSTTDVVTNTFTVGNVKITLDEAKVTEYGVKDGDSRVTGNTYKLIPGHTYVKDPTVHVEAGSEVSYLFVKVTNGIEDIEAATTIADQMEANWVLVDETSGVWRYKTTVNPGDYKVFESFKLKDTADVTGYADAKITIVACAVQADGLTETTALQQVQWPAA